MTASEVQKFVIATKVTNYAAQSHEGPFRRVMPIVNPGPPVGDPETGKFLKILVRPERFERPTLRFVV